MRVLIFIIFSQNADNSVIQGRYHIIVERKRKDVVPMGIIKNK